MVILFFLRLNIFSIFTSYGHKVINCSADTPVFGLKELIETRMPNVILISVTYIKEEKETLNEIKELEKLNRKINAKLFIAGASNQLISNKILSNFKTINSMEDVDKIAKDINNEDL